MPNFPSLDAFRAQCFSDLSGGSAAASTLPLWSQVLSWVQNRSLTQPSSAAASYRHPNTQAGMVLSDTGETALRAGHATYDHTVGASITLQPGGAIVITGPNGIIYSGTLTTRTNPTNALSFSGGQYRIHEQWTHTPVVVPVENIPGWFDNFFVLDSGGTPIPLSVVLAMVPFYRTPAVSLLTTQTP